LGAAIRTYGLSKRFGTTDALADLNLEVPLWQANDGVHGSPREWALRPWIRAVRDASLARMDDQRAKTVLLVDLDATERDHLGKALEDAGFQVLGCPGPSFPDYTCVGAREGDCPLVEHADAVVLDLWTRGDELGFGTSGEELLELYVSSGRPVVSLGPGGQLTDPTAEERVIRLDEHPEAERVVAAVRRLPPAA